MKLSCVLVLTLTNFVIASPFSFSAKGSGASATGAAVSPFGTFAFAQPVKSKVGAYSGSFSKSSSSNFASSSANLGSFNYNGASASGTTGFGAASLTVPNGASGQFTTTSNENKKNSFTGFSDSHSYGTAGGNVAQSNANSEKDIQFSGGVSQGPSSLQSSVLPGNNFNVGFGGSSGSEFVTPGSSNPISGNYQSASQFASNSASYTSNTDSSLPPGTSFTSTQNKDVTPTSEKQTLYAGGFGGPPGVLSPFDSSSVNKYPSAGGNNFVSSYSELTSKPGTYKPNSEFKGTSENFKYPSQSNIVQSSSEVTPTDQNKPYTGGFGASSGVLVPSKFSSTGNNYVSTYKPTAKPELFETSKPDTQFQFTVQKEPTYIGSIGAEVKPTNQPSFDKTEYYSQSTSVSPTSFETVKPSSDKPVAQSSSSGFSTTFAPFTASSGSFATGVPIVTEKPTYQSSSGSGILSGYSSPTKVDSTLTGANPTYSSLSTNYETSSGVQKPVGQSFSSSSSFTTANVGSGFSSSFKPQYPTPSVQPATQKQSLYQPSSGSAAGFSNPTKVGTVFITTTPKYPSLSENYGTSSNAQKPVGHSFSNVFSTVNSGANFNSNFNSKYPTPSVQPAFQKQPSYQLSSGNGAISAFSKPKYPSQSESYETTSNVQKPVGQSFSSSSSLSTTNVEKDVSSNFKPQYPTPSVQLAAQKQPSYQISSGNGVISGFSNPTKEGTVFITTSPKYPSQSESYETTSDVQKPVGQTFSSGSSFTTINSGANSNFKPQYPTPSVQPAAQKQPSFESDKYSGYSNPPKGSSVFITTTPKYPSLSESYGTSSDVQKPVSQFSSGSSYSRPTVGTGLSSSFKPQYPTPSVQPAAQKQPSFESEKQSGYSNSPEGGSVFITTTPKYPSLSESYGTSSDVQKPVSQFSSGSSFSSATVGTGLSSSFKPQYPTPSVQPAAQKQPSFESEKQSGYSNLPEGGNVFITTTPKYPSLSESYGTSSDVQKPVSQFSSGSSFSSATVGTGLSSSFKPQYPTPSVQPAAQKQPSFESEKQSGYSNLPEGGNVFITTTPKYPSLSESYGTSSDVQKPVSQFSSGSSFSSATVGAGLSSSFKPQYPSPSVQPAAQKQPTYSTFETKPEPTKPTYQSHQQDISYTSSTPSFEYSSSVASQSFDKKPTIGQKETGDTGSLGLASFPVKPTVTNTQKKPAYLNAFVTQTGTVKPSGQYYQGGSTYFSSSEKSKTGQYSFTSQNKPYISGVIGQSGFPKPSNQTPSSGSSSSSLSTEEKFPTTTYQGVSYPSPTQASGFSSTGLFDKSKPSNQYTFSSQNKPPYENAFGSPTVVPKPLNQPSTGTNNFVSTGTITSFKPNVTPKPVEASQTSGDISIASQKETTTFTGSVSGASVDVKPTNQPSFDGTGFYSTESGVPLVQTAGSLSSSTATFSQQSAGKPTSSYPDTPKVSYSGSVISQKQPSFVSGSYSTTQGVQKPTSFSSSFSQSSSNSGASFGSTYKPQTLFTFKQPVSFAYQKKPTYSSTFGAYTGSVKPTSQTSFGYGSSGISGSFDKQKPSSQYNYNNQNEPSFAYGGISEVSKPFSTGTGYVSSSTVTPNQPNLSQDPFDQSKPQVSSVTKQKDTTYTSSFGGVLSTSKPTVQPLPSSSFATFFEQTPYQPSTGIAKPTNIVDTSKYSSISYNTPNKPTSTAGQVISSDTQKLPTQSFTNNPSYSTSSVKPNIISQFDSLKPAVVSQKQPVFSSGFSDNSGVSKVTSQKESAYVGEFGETLTGVKATSHSSSNNAQYITGSSVYPTPFVTPKPIQSVEFSSQSEAHTSNSAFTGAPNSELTSHNSPSHVGFDAVVQNSQSQSLSGTYKPTNSATSTGTSTQSGAYYQSKPNIKVTVTSQPKPSTSIVYQPYTGGFGGPTGILKPNEFNIPSHLSNSQQQYNANTGVNTGFGTPLVVEKHNGVSHIVHSSEHSSNLQNTGIYSSTTGQSTYPSNTLNVPGSQQSGYGQESKPGSEANAVAQAGFSGQANAAGFFDGNQEGYKVQNQPNLFNTGLNSAKGSNTYSGQTSGLNGFGATASAKTFGGTGAFGFGGNFASSSAQTLGSSGYGGKVGIVKK